ncbi:MAG: aminotransferase class V-fold PLP-dependent enzyme [Verrucomicrobia bacterium]|nr:aminotransferase class V-fold PLP-dependent enzyme [Verrucomicrobiota bacterium]
MTLADLLTDEALRAHEFPVAAKQVFLAHAGVAPLPRRVTEAIAAFTRACAEADQEAVLSPGFFQELRQLGARLLGARPEEIALVGPTSLALSFVAQGLSFRKRDNVVVYFEDYPSNVYPWMNLAARGCEVRFLSVRQLGRIRTAEVLGAVDEQTRLVALASCHFVAGWRIDLGEIGQALHDRGILFCVDGIQTLGAFPTPVQHIDFLAADAHKWLLGPCAAGLLYVRQSVQEALAPVALGWQNVRCPNYVAEEDLVLKPDARRYEAGSANLLGLVGLKAALELLLEIGIDAIAARLLELRAFLIRALQDRGYSVLYPDAPPAHASAIVSCHRPGTDLAAVHQRLAVAGVQTSLRADRTGRQYLRFSPHFYNTQPELARALGLL